MIRLGRSVLVFAWLMSTTTCLEANESLNPDPSFEIAKPRDQFGRVFEKWEGWIYEGDGEFRTSRIAHTGNQSCLLFAGGPAKLRIYRTLKNVQPGRYRITAYIRGLDIGTGEWDQTTEFAFAEKYMPLNKNGTFGWTKLTYVTHIDQVQESLAGPSIGLMAPGFLWVDDVSITEVSSKVALTDKPILGPEESPIPIETFDLKHTYRCPVCGYKIARQAKRCKVCGASLRLQHKQKGPATKRLTSFEDDRSVGQFQNLGAFSDCSLSSKHATHGHKSLKIEKGYTSWDAQQDWSGYDFLVADVFTRSEQPMELMIEIWDKQTKEYWTRVNLPTVIPPGKSVLSLPIDQLYVGEKARPGRKLLLDKITRLVLSIGDSPRAPVYIDNIRLVRNEHMASSRSKSLWAFDFGTSKSPLMPGFKRIDASVRYAPGRGYGLKDAQIWRIYDVLQPDPLYRDFICIEKGGLAIDVPNGQYRVFVNLDNPSGYWGEYQAYQRRTVLAEGKPVVTERMSYESFRDKYFRFWDTEDLPQDNTFDKYQNAYFHEKEFTVTVRDRQLNIDFLGQDWACSVSTVVVFPLKESEQGQAFLSATKKSRRFYFDNTFKRVLPPKVKSRTKWSADDKTKGYKVFHRDSMQDVNWDSVPGPADKTRIAGFGYAGDIEPLTLSIVPYRDLGLVNIRISALVGPMTIPSHNVDVGYVSYRITRVTMDGCVYTIKPRLIIPKSSIRIDRGITRRFWLTLHVPADAKAGRYTGQVTIQPAQGQSMKVPVSFRIYRGQILPADIPVGPWGHQIRLPWLAQDPKTKQFNLSMTRKSLFKLIESGFTTLTGLPQIRYKGFRDHKPVFDFSLADKQMKLVRQAGFRMPIVNYTTFEGLDLYYQDIQAMQNAGFSNYAKFIHTVFGAIQEHATANQWLDVYWNLGDEPLADDLPRAIKNAQAYQKAFPTGPPYFTAATSVTSSNKKDEYFQFAKSVHVANLHGHNHHSVEILRAAGKNWAFYNAGNRFSYGIYMYKAVKQYDMKFRLAWHWNNTAGDPFYALDCREDDYAWAQATPSGQLITSVEFERQFREGLDDYRLILTLDKLAKAKNDSAAKKHIRTKLDSFELGQYETNEIISAQKWQSYRRVTLEHIERLSP